MKLRCYCRHIGAGEEPAPEGGRLGCGGVLVGGRNLGPAPCSCSVCTPDLWLEHSDVCLVLSSPIRADPRQCLHHRRELGTASGQSAQLCSLQTVPRVLRFLHGGI